jgi:galactose-1-phosphate uridylyltransferase
MDPVNLTFSRLYSSYPMMIYDTLPKGGASQFHPHAHGFLASQYLSHMAVQHRAAISYKDENGSEYWNDLIELHHALGLSVTLGDAVAISPLVSHHLETNIFMTNFSF